MTSPTLPIGTRVRIVAGRSITSHILAGREGVITERDPRLIEVEDEAHLLAYPHSVSFDGRQPFVWSLDELEVIS